MSVGAGSKNTTEQDGVQPVKSAARTHRPDVLTQRKAGEVRSTGGLRRTLLISLLAVVLIGLGRYWQIASHRQWLEKASLDELSKQASLHEDDVEIFARLGLRAREAEQWPRAARAFQHAAELAPDRVEIWVGWARSVYETAGYPAANTILSDYIARHPTSSRAYLERALLDRLGSHSDQAWDDVEKATQLDPNNGQAWALRGDLCLDKGIPGEGRESYKKARALMPDSPWPCVGLFQAYTAEQKDAEAAEMARYIVKNFPEIPEGGLYLGEALTESATSPAEFEEARRVLLRAQSKENLLREKDRFTLHLLVARTYIKQNRWAEALPRLLRAREFGGDNPDMLFLLGRTYRALGKTALAEATMTQHRQVYEKTETLRQMMARVNEKPTDAGARLTLARFYVKHDAIPKAISQYEEMISRNIAVETAVREKEALEQRREAR